MGCMITHLADAIMTSNTTDVIVTNIDTPPKVLLITGYLREHATDPNINIPIDVVRIIQQFEPKLIWRSEKFGNVGGGGAYEHIFDSPISALKFNHFYSNGTHLLIHGYALRNSPNMRDIKVGCQTSGESANVIKEFNGNIVECTVHWGGWYNSVKGLEFVTDLGTNYMAGSTSENSQIIKPNEGYALCGFHGGSGWFVDSIGFVFVAV